MRDEVTAIRGGSPLDGLMRTSSGASIRTSPSSGPVPRIIVTSSRMAATYPSSARAGVSIPSDHMSAGAHVAG